MKRLFTFLYIAVVCAILLTPFVVWITGTTDPRPFFENRARAELPAFDPSFLDPYPQKFESHFNDYFPYRNSIIFWLNFSDTRYFGKSPVPEEVTIGEDGWLYPGTRLLSFSLGQQPLTESMITAMITELNDRGEKCKAIGAEYRLVIVPSKATLYPEHLPLAYQFTTWSNPVDAFRARCDKESTVPVLYLQDSLMLYKEKAELFFRYDSHWNNTGTYYGYRSIMNWIYGKDAAKKIFPVDPSDCIAQWDLAGNYSAMLGMDEHWYENYCVLKEPDTSIVRDRVKENYPCDSGWFSYCSQYEVAFQNRDTTLPGLMVVRDSYTNTYLQKLLASGFGRSVFIWDYWQHKLNNEILRKEKPDVVLCIISESTLTNLLKYRNDKEPGGANFMKPMSLLGSAMRGIRTSAAST